MHIEIRAKGTNSILQYQSYLKGYITRGTLAISGFEVAKKSVYNLTGGAGNLQSAAESINARINKDKARIGNAKKVLKKSEDFVSFAATTDYKVAKNAVKVRNEFYHNNPWVKPLVSAKDKKWYNKAFDWLGEAGKKVGNTVSKAGKSIDSTYKKAKKSVSDYNKKLNETHPYCDDCGYLMTRFSVTVPASLTLVMDRNGNVYTPTNAAITNNSTGNVMVTSITLTPKNGWTVVAYTTNMSNEKVDSKKIGLKIQDGKSKSDGTIPVIGSWTIFKNSSLNLNYSAVVSATSHPVNNQNVVDVTFVIDWRD